MGELLNLIVIVAIGVFIFSVVINVVLIVYFVTAILNKREKRRHQLESKIPRERSYLAKLEKRNAFVFLKASDSLSRKEFHDLLIRETTAVNDEIFMTVFDNRKVIYNETFWNWMPKFEDYTIVYHYGNVDGFRSKK